MTDIRSGLLPAYCNEKVRHERLPGTRREDTLADLMPGQSNDKRIAEK